MSIATLLGRKGDVREILKASKGNILDLSDASWDTQGVVLSQLNFEEVILSGKWIRPDFVDCTFKGCIFRNLSSESHFWGASNLWIDCEFERLRLDDVISPQNRFIDCRFKDVYLRRYRVSETAFINCTFDRMTVEGLSVQGNTRNRAVRAHMAELWNFPEIVEMDSMNLSLLFRDCRFENPVFKYCDFRNTSFEKSTFLDPVSEASIFNGAEGVHSWWDELDGEDTPTNAYIKELRRLIIERLGPSSWSRSRLKVFFSRYEGRFIRSDWFEDLVENGIPDHEYDIVEEIMDELNRHFSS